MEMKSYTKGQTEGMVEVKYTTTTKDDYISDEEYASYFDEYKKVCEGCQLMNAKCEETSVIMCYLRRLLPHGVWTKASMNDIATKNGEEIADEINKAIVEKLMKERK